LEISQLRTSLEKKLERGRLMRESRKQNRRGEIAPWFWGIDVVGFKILQ